MFEGGGNRGGSCFTTLDCLEGLGTYMEHMTLEPVLAAGMPATDAWTAFILAIIVDPMQTAASSQAHAGWVQALGALAALLVTVLLNRSDARDRKIERDARARNAAIIVLPVFAEFRQELVDALSGIKSGKSLSLVGPVDDDGEGHGLAGIWVPPPRLTGMLSSFAELGGAAKATQMAYRSMEELHRAFMEHYIEEIGECLYDDEAMNQKSITTMVKCKASVEVAIGELEALFS